MEINVTVLIWSYSIESNNKTAVIPTSICKLGFADKIWNLCIYLDLMNFVFTTSALQKLNNTLSLYKDLNSILVLFEHPIHERL